MSRSETTVTVLVASPSDVSEERDSLEAIVDEVNRTHASRTGVRLALLRWEKDVSPAVGEDPQAVINDQIPQDYDVFVGIFWNRFGSPTSRAESGTLEEFSMAKARYDENPASIHLMLYFKDAPPLNMDDFDPDQYKKVQEFRSQAGKEAFYRIFSTADDFANFIRIDLTKLVCDGSFAKGKASDSAREEQVRGALTAECRYPEDDDEYDDEGYLDLQEAFEEEMDSLNATLKRINDSVTDIGGNIHQRTEEIVTLNLPDAGKDLPQNVRQKMRADAKRVMKRASNDMDAFVTSMRHDIPLFRRHLDKSINVFTKAVPIYLELNEDDDKQDLKDTIRSMLDAMEGIVKSMQEFRDTVAELPRMTTTLVRSRRRTEKVLQEVIDITKGGCTSLEGVLSMLP